MPRSHRRPTATGSLIGDAATRVTNAASELWHAIEATDRPAVRRRIAEFKRDNPGVGRDELHKRLVYAKCLQAGLIGAVSGLTEIIPGVGRVIGLALGPLADATLVSALQAELVAETFALYGVELPHQLERMAVLGIAATNIGAKQAGVHAAKAIGRRALQLPGGRLLGVALPLAGIATNAAANIAVTYAIGMRSRALCRMKDASLEDWPNLLREVTMIDERRLARWAGEAASAAFDQVTNVTRTWLDRLGEFVPIVPGAPPKKQRRAPSKRAAARKTATKRTRTRRKT
jgi:uncharacterized protein (DUF697 family)